MNPRKSPYNGKLFNNKILTYGLHSKCKRCYTLKEGKCENPQYKARGVKDFFCADYNERKIKKHIAEKATASEIRQALGITEKDQKIVKEIINKSRR